MPKRSLHSRELGRDDKCHYVSPLLNNSTLLSYINMVNIITKNQSETIEYGKKIATNLKGGDILLLAGDLGAGKTTLVKGIALGLGIKNKITSPTFTLMNLYEIKSPKACPERKSNGSKIKNMVHIDTYRLESENNLIEIGAEDYLGDMNTICIIEWPEKITSLLANKRVVVIKIEHSDDNNRTISYGL